MRVVAMLICRGKYTHTAFPHVYSVGLCLPQRTDSPQASCQQHHLVRLQLFSLCIQFRICIDTTIQYSDNCRRIKTLRTRLTWQLIVRNLNQNDRCIPL